MRAVWETLKRLYRNMGRDDVGGLAAQMSFAYLFSVFPFLICLYLLLSWIGRSTAALPWLLERLSRYLPAESLETIETNFDSIAANFSANIFTISTLVMLYIVSRAFRVAMRAFDRMLAVPPEQQRGLLLANALAYGMAVFSVVAVIVSFNLTIIGHRLVTGITETIGLYGFWGFAVRYLRLPVAFLFTFVSVAAIYRVSPSVTVRLRHVVAGAFVFTVLWLAMTRGFALYVSRFIFYYHRVYGALSGIIILLVWVYAGSVIFLLGGEVTAALRDISRQEEEATSAAPAR